MALPLTYIEKNRDYKRMRGLGFIIVFFLLISTPFATIAQEARVDTIVLVSGKKVLGKVHGVSSTKITYYPEGKSKTEEFARKQIQIILYSTGRREFFNKPAFEMVEARDFKTIVLTENEEEVAGLYELGTVEAKSSKNARSAKAAQQSADIRIQKKAVNMGGYIVLITKRESKGGYGEIPTHFVEGIVYGVDPPTTPPPTNNKKK